MSGQPDRPYPSRRQLREQGWTTGSIEALTDTGSIRISDDEVAQVQQEQPLPTPSPEQLAQLPVPQSRRERREQERLIATGAIPVVNPSEPGSSTPPLAASGAVQAPSEPISEPPAVSAPDRPVQDVGRPEAEDGQWRLLTRRERREMERRGETVPETGWIPIIRDDSEGVQDAEVSGPEPEQLEEPDAAVQADAPAPRSTSSSYTVQAAQFSVAIEVHDEDDQDGATDTDDEVSPAPLPPVFQTPPSAGDAPTAPAQEVGVGTDTAHALILPVAPSTDLTGPMGQTGEVIVTGNIDLPRYVSERALTSENDFADDFSDFEAVETETFTAPVRATDAVSTRTSQIDQPMIRAPRWGAASIALGASAALLGITAVGLLALALLTDMIELPF